MQRRLALARWQALVAGLLLCAAGTGLPARAVAETVGATRPSAATPAVDEDDALLESIGPGPWDPFERVNRVSFWINRGIEASLLDPLSQLYGWAVPDPAKHCVRRFFTNLNSAAVFVNDVLQVQAEDAVITTFRFAINTSAGVGGMFDPASALGLRGHESDFGETLAVFGVPAGPYVFFPVLGPAMARDAIGRAVDGFMRPQFYLLGPLERLTLDATDGVTLRERHLDALRALRESALDYYSAYRGAYVMSREAELRRRAEASRGSKPVVGGPIKLGPWAWSERERNAPSVGAARADASAGDQRRRNDSSPLASFLTLPSSALSSPGSPERSNTAE